jgi:hypothetical protein
MLDVWRNDLDATALIRCRFHRYYCQHRAFRLLNRGFLRTHGLDEKDIRPAEVPRNVTNVVWSV